MHLYYFSLKQLIAGNITIDGTPQSRPGGMNSLLACNSVNSYKNLQGQWAR